MIELIAFFVGCKVLAVKAVFALTASYGCATFEEFHANLARNKTLAADNELCKILMECTKPLPIVNKVRIFLRDNRFKALGLFAHGERFHFAMCKMKDHACWGFVEFARFDAH